MFNLDIFNGSETAILLAALGLFLSVRLIPYLGSKPSPRRIPVRSAVHDRRQAPQQRRYYD